MNASMKRVASSTVCWRAPIAMTFASLCCRASSAVDSFQTSAARTPAHLVGGDLLAVARAAEDDAERLDARLLVAHDGRAPR